MSRKLDVAVAEVLGYKVVWVDEYLSEFMESTKRRVPVINYVSNNEYDYIPHYSTDGNAMLLLDREMQARGWLVLVVNEDTFVSAEYIKIKRNKDTVKGIAEAQTEPLARALAAYKALSGKEWQNA